MMSTGGVIGRELRIARLKAEHPVADVATFIVVQVSTHDVPGLSDRYRM